MSMAVWPPLSPDELKYEREQTLKRELDWIVRETVDVLRELKHGLDDCYALLAPIDPGSTLVMSTPRNEKVKGTLTRVGTRIVKGAIHLQLRTVATQTITLDPSRPIHIPALATINTYLNQCIDLVAVVLSCPANAASLSAQLRVLAHSLAESSALLKGQPDSDPSWTTASCSPSHFSPPTGPNVSFHLGLQDSCLVLWLRALEPVDAPVHFHTKLGLAIGTVRRLEHDEMDQVFRYIPDGIFDEGVRHGADRKDGKQAPVLSGRKVTTLEVFVREKVRVDSADPSLMSLSAKLGSLSRTLAQARENLAAVMGEDLQDGAGE